MKEAVMADPVQVVKQALIDAKYKKRFLYMARQ